MKSSEDTALKLVESVYRAALDPQGYDDFMGSWDDWMSARMQALDGLRGSDPAMASPDLSAHFELALRLLEKLGDAPSTPRLKGPQVLMDPSGALLWQNAEADRLLGSGRGRRICDLSVSPDHRDLLTAFLSRLSNAKDLSPLVVQIAAPDGGRPLAFRAERIQEGGNRTLALLSSLAPSWPAAADQLLMEANRLTAGECAICVLLVDGLSAASIARRRGTSVATVRTQIKKILSKTRQSSQAELQSYLFGLMRMAEDMPAPEPALPLPSTVGGRVHDLTIAGRRMIVEEHGPRDGRPVVFLHGMLDGTGTTRRIRDLLADHDLRLVCPHRPAFGRSEPMTGPPARALSQFGTDLADLLANRGIVRPVLVGHMAGALYAYAAARPCNACGLVSVSGGVPIVAQAQFDAMTRRQRLVAYTARFAPSVLPFVLNAGIRQIRGGGEETFMRSLYENAPVDLAVLEDDAIRALVLDGYRFSVAQGHLAFATDSHHVVRDWTGMFEDTAPVPVHLIHGAHDPVVAPESVRAFADLHGPRVVLTEIENAGQLVFYQSPEQVLRIVSDMASAVSQDG